MVWMHTCTRFTSIVMNTWSCICTMCLCMCTYDVHHCMIYSAALWSRVILILIFTNYNAPIFMVVLWMFMCMWVFTSLCFWLYLYAHQWPHHTACVVNSYGHNIQDLFWHAFIIIGAPLVSRHQHLCHNFLLYCNKTVREKQLKIFHWKINLYPLGNLVTLFQQEECLVTMHMKATVTLVNWNSVYPTQLDFPSMVDPAKINQLSM